MIEAGGKLIVTPRLFEVAGYILLREVSCVDGFGWLLSSGTVITSGFAFVDSRSWVSAIDWAWQWWSRLLSGNDDSENSVWALSAWSSGFGGNKLLYSVMRVCLGFGFFDLWVDASLSTGISAVWRRFVPRGLAILTSTGFTYSPLHLAKKNFD